MLTRSCGPECLTFQNADGETPFGSPNTVSLSSGARIGCHRSVPSAVIRRNARSKQRPSLDSCHSSKDATFTDGFERFHLSVGTLDLEQLQSLLELIVAAEPGTIAALDSDGLFPLQIACRLNFPVPVISMLLREHPESLRFLSSYCS